MGFVLPSAACNCPCSSLYLAKRAKCASLTAARPIQAQTHRSTSCRKPYAPSLQDHSSTIRPTRQRIHTVRCAAHTEPMKAEQTDEGQEGGEAEDEEFAEDDEFAEDEEFAEGDEDEAVEDDDPGGYTPAEFVYYSEDDKHLCFHEIRVVTETPVQVCFDVWDDWRRLVDFLDLIAQIGLDPQSPDMGLFQCFYRWGQTPILELTFILQKIEVVKCERILFKTVWGMPLAGIVEFISLGPNRTETRFQLRYRLPEQLAEFVGRIGVEGHVHEILHENFAVYKKLVEGIAGGTAQPPREPVERALEGCPAPDSPLKKAAMEEYMDEAVDAELDRVVEEDVAREMQEAQARLDRKAQRKADQEAQAAAAAVAGDAGAAHAEHAEAAPPGDLQPAAAPPAPEPSVEAVGERPRGRGRRTQQVPPEPAASTAPAGPAAAPLEPSTRRRRSRLVPSTSAAAPAASPAAPVGPKQRRRTSAAAGPTAAAAAASPAEPPQGALADGSNGQPPKQRRRTTAAGTASAAAAGASAEQPQATTIPDPIAQPGSDGQQVPKRGRRRSTAAGAPAAPPQASAGAGTPEPEGSLPPAPARGRRATQGRKPSQSVAKP